MKSGVVAARAEGGAGGPRLQRSPRGRKQPSPHIAAGSWTWPWPRGSHCPLLRADRECTGAQPGRTAPKTHSVLLLKSPAQSLMPQCINLKGKEALRLTQKFLIDPQKHTVRAFPDQLPSPHAPYPTPSQCVFGTASACRPPIQFSGLEEVWPLANHFWVQRGTLLDPQPALTLPFPHRYQVVRTANTYTSVLVQGWRPVSPCLTP